MRWYDIFIDRLLLIIPIPRSSFHNVRKFYSTSNLLQQLLLNDRTPCVYSVCSIILYVTSSELSNQVAIDRCAYNTLQSP